MTTSITCNYCNQLIYTNRTIYKGQDHTFCSHQCRSKELYKLKNIKQTIMKRLFLSPTNISIPRESYIKRHKSYSEITIDSQNSTQNLINLDEEINSKFCPVKSIYLTIQRCFYFISCIFVIYGFRLYSTNLYNLNSI